MENGANGECLKNVVRHKHTSTNMFDGWNVTDFALLAFFLLESSKLFGRYACWLDEFHNKTHYDGSSEENAENAECNLPYHNKNSCIV